MKRLISVFLLFVSSFMCKAQFIRQWTYQFDSSTSGVGFLYGFSGYTGCYNNANYSYYRTKCISTNRSKVAIVGNSNCDIFVGVLNTDGTLSYQNTNYNSGSDYGTSLSYDKAGNLNVTGLLSNNTTLYRQFSDSGSLNFTNLLSTFNRNFLSVLKLDTNDRIFLNGQIYNGSTNYQSLYCYNKYGTQLWNDTITDYDWFFGYPGAMCIDKSNNIIFTGKRQAYSSGDYDIVIRKVDTSGHTIWKIYYSNASGSIWTIADDYINDVITDDSGNVYFSMLRGQTNQTKVVKLDASTGAIVWDRVVDNYAVGTSQGGTLRICGINVVVGFSNQIKAYDLISGNLSWYRSFSLSAAYPNFTSLETKNNNIYFTTYDSLRIYDTYGNRIFSCDAHISGKSTAIRWVEIDSSGNNLYLVGEVQGSSGYQKIFVTKYSTCTSTIYDSTNINICGNTYNFNGINYDSSGIYTQHYYTNLGCDSFCVLRLVLNRISHDTIENIICNGDSILFTGLSYTSSGYYTRHFTTINGCDSNVTLHLTVNPTYNFNIYDTICGGDSVLFAGITYTSSGIYSRHFITISGCDSIVTLHLTVNSTYNLDVYDTICDGNSVTFAGLSYTSSGIYSRHFITISGCDSNVTLHLIVNPTYTQTIYDTICNGNSVTFAGISYTSSGIYSRHFTTINGCDSNVTLHLTVNPTYNFNIYDTICNGNSVTFAGISYTTSGTYSRHFTTVSGCDSNVTLHLIVNPTYNDTINSYICDVDTFTYAGISYTTSGTYLRHFTTINGCDSNVTLHLIVNPTYNFNIYDTICSGGSILFAGVSYTTSGTYSRHFTTVSGCDSNVTLHLTVDSTYNLDVYDTICDGNYVTFAGISYMIAGTYSRHFTTINGCDSNVTLHLTVNPTYLLNIFDTICNGDVFTYAGSSYITSGIYSRHFTTISGCDSIVNLHLTVNPTYNLNVYDTICSGGIYTYAGVSYTLSGSYFRHFTTINGCDSNVTLHLVVNPTYNLDVYDTICNGDSILFAGISYTTSGTYLRHFTTVGGCDSNVTLHLTVNPTYTQTIYGTICNGDSVLFAGISYTIAGTYLRHFTTINGCDSNVTLHLTVNPTYLLNIYDTICNGDIYTYAGVTYTTSGIYTRHFTTINGCDSNITLHLVVNPIYNDTIDRYICNFDTFIYAGVSYTLSGSYFRHFTTINGCDSNVTLHLVVNPTYNLDVYDTICNGDSILFAGISYTTSGIYTRHFTTIRGCDSNVTLHLTVNPTYILDVYDTICNGDVFTYAGVSYTLNGIYLRNFTTINGCDSNVTLHLTVNPTYNLDVYDTICSGDIFTYADSSYITSGTYPRHFASILGCDSNVTLHLVVNPTYNLNVYDTICSGDSVLFATHIINVSGSYTNNFYTTKGCDSIVTLHLTVIPLPYSGVISGNSILCDSSNSILVTTGSYGNWMSANSSICSVSYDGHIYANSLGTTTISYVVTNYCGISTSTHSISVIGLVHPSLSISVNDSDVCEGTSVTLNAISINGGTTPKYYWLNNGILFDSGSSVTSVFNDFDVIKCELYGSQMCSVNPVFSNNVVIHVTPIVTPNIDIISSKDTINIGNSVSFNSDVSYVGINPHYQWYLNNLPIIGANDATWFSDFYYSGYVYCVVTSSIECVTKTVDTSNTKFIYVRGKNFTNDVNVSISFSNENINISNLYEEVNIQIIDMLGRIFYNKVASINGSISISLDTFANSEYIIRISNSNINKSYHFVLIR